MKKKPITNYPTIPALRIDQFTLPELAVQLLRDKQFIKGLHKLFPNSVIGKNTVQPLTSPISNGNNMDKSLSVTSKTSKTKSNQKHIKFPKNLSGPSQEVLVSEQERQQECQFIFQQQVKNKMMYPWVLADNGSQQVVECNFITDQISDVIQETIQSSLHKILNKQFINVTNEILAMRQQMNVFTNQQLERSQNTRQLFQRQFERMHKKLQQQQHISTSILNQPLQRFSRSKGLISTSLSNSSTKQSSQSNQFHIYESDSKMSVHHQIHGLKKEVESLKKSMSPSSSTRVNGELVKQLQEKVSILQDKINQMTLTAKLSAEEGKQKCKKNYQLLYSQFSVSNSKQFTCQQVKRSVKSNLRIYLDQIMKCKKDIEQLYDRIDRNDKGMQQYMGNQLKNLWTLVSGIKTRIQNVQEQCNVGMDQSFVL